MRDERRGGSAACCARLADELAVAEQTGIPIPALTEPEIAFLLDEEMGGPTTIAAVLAATRSVFPALEVIDSRYADFSFRLPDVVADNASAASVVIGSHAVSPEAAGDLRLIGCVLRVDGAVVDTAAGAAVMGHPAAAVAWLVDHLAEEGRSLPAGSIVLSGALTDAVPVRAGVTLTAELDGLGIVEVTA
jgi:2-oxo-3-hexenedioate decarboxylase